MASGIYTELRESAFDGLPTIDEVVEDYGFRAAWVYAAVQERLDTVVRAVAEFLDDMDVTVVIVGDDE